MAVVLACADRQKPSILDNKVYVVVYGIVLFLLVQYFIPMVVLTVLNSYVITSLRRSTAYRTGVLLSYRAREPPLGSVRSCNSLTAVAVPTPSRKSVQCSSTFESARRVTIIVIVVVFMCIVSYTFAMTAQVMWSLEIAFPSWRDTPSVERCRRYMAQLSNLVGGTLPSLHGAAEQPRRYMAQLSNLVGGTLSALHGTAEQPRRWNAAVATWHS